MTNEFIPGGCTLWARQTIESEIFFYKPDKWFKIWFYIVNRVNHTENRLFKRGSALFTYEEMMFKTGATKKQIEGCVKWLEKESMMESRKTTRGRVRIVLNYAKFQELKNYKESAKESAKGNRRRVEGELKGVSINKNVKNDKNDKKTVSRFAPQQIDYELSNLLRDKIKENTPTFREPKIDSWAINIEKMRRLDKRTEEQIRFTIGWCQENSFWQANILSTKKLRDKFDYLVAQIKRDKSNSKGITII